MTDQTDKSMASNGAAPASAPASSNADPGAAFDAVLKDFEAKTKESASQPVTLDHLSRLTKGIQPVVEFVNLERQAKLDARIDADLNTSIDDIAKSYPDAPQAAIKKIIRDALYHMVDTDDAAREGWQNRDSAPPVWNGFKDKLKTEIGAILDDFKPKTETNDTRTDLDRAAAAVRNVSTQPTPVPDFDPVKAFNMGDREWENYKRDYYSKQRAASG